MTEKRFEVIKSEITGLYVPIDEQKYYNFSGFENEYDCMRIVNALNNLYDMKVENGKIASAYLKENEQLKQQIKDCKTYNATLYANNTKSDRMLVNDIKELRLTLKEHQKYIEEQHNENIKLKGELKNLRRLANEMYMEGSE